MTRKHYVAIARIIADEKRGNHILFHNFVERICQVLETTNPLFDSEKFKKASGYYQD